MTQSPNNGGSEPQDDAARDGDTPEGDAKPPVVNPATPGSPPPSQAPRPPLLLLGGEPQWSAYEAEFRRLYNKRHVVDVLGRTVIFGQDSAKHVCFKAPGSDPYFRKPRTEWSQERAERIPWISHILASPDEIRPNKATSSRQSYFLHLPATGSCKEEMYFLAVGVESKTQVQFLTAYPVDRNYWNQAKQAGKATYKAKRGK